jgi:hypothetical protein
MKWWPTLLFALAAFFFFDYFSLKETQELTMLNDGCFVQSLYFQHATQAQQTLEQFVWSRVLCIQFHGKLGHAVTIFIYKNITWIYDPNRGSFPIANYPLYDPLMAAEIAFPKLIIKEAYYVEPTFLLHYQNDAFTMEK